MNRVQEPASRRDVLAHGRLVGALVGGGLQEVARREQPERTGRELPRLVDAAVAGRD